jgi:DNA-binding FadR family transcriptional regulator
MSDPEFRRLYARISREIGRKIMAGVYPVGERLPAERVLAQTYGVSRPTVREAIIALEVDQLVEVRMGSGVFVTATVPKGGVRVEPDMGPFELLEARRAIEGETCALAAQRISDDDLDQLRQLLTVMGDVRAENLESSEKADYAFHLCIARASQNGGLVASVDMLWKARDRSPQYQLMSAKAHAAGVFPRLKEHVAILDALIAHDPARARQAMRRHISRVLEEFMAATEVHEIEQARNRVAQQRERFAAGA